MYYHDGIRKHGLHSVISCSDEGSILLRISLQVSHSLGDNGLSFCILLLPTGLWVHFYRPQQSVGGLIAHLHPLRSDAIILEKGKNLDGMVSQCLLHLLEGEFLPCRRDILLGRVCPPVAVVEIYHHVHSERLGTLCLLQHVFL